MKFIYNLSQLPERTGNWLFLCRNLLSVQNFQNVVGTPYSHFIKKAEADTKTAPKEFVSQINKSNIFLKIGKSLNDNGFTYGLEWDVLSDKDVEVQVKLPKKNISEETKKRVENIVNSVVKENNFDTNIFKINVTNYGNASPQIIEQSKKE